MKTTNILASKTFWLNMLTLLGLVLTYLIDSKALSTNVLATVATINGILNIVVRFWTSTPITGSPKDPNVN